MVTKNYSLNFLPFPELDGEEQGAVTETQREEHMETIIYPPSRSSYWHTDSACPSLPSECKNSEHIPGPFIFLSPAIAFFVSKPTVRYLGHNT